MAFLSLLKKFVMKLTFLLAFPIVCLLSCKPAGNSEDGGTRHLPDTTEHKGSVDGASDTKSVREGIVKCVSDRNSDGLINEESYTKLKALVPQLPAGADYWNIVTAIPAAQRGPFRDSIREALRALTPLASQHDSAIFFNAHLVARELLDPEVAKIALAQLQLAEPYTFPEMPLKGWPNTPEYAMHIFRGVQGLLCKTVVQSSDNETLSLYRKRLKSETPQLQRVMIWALGGSEKLEDFELLMTLRDKVPDDGTKDTLVRALNGIVASMQRSVDNPAGLPPERRPANPNEVLKATGECRARLERENLIVALGMND